MLELEHEVHTHLSSPARQRRFGWLTRQRRHIAETIAFLACWGVGDTPALDRQLQLTEDAVLAMVDDPAVAATLSAEYAVADAELLHARGMPPAGLACPVCADGKLGLEDILARLPEPIE